jgi:hypothetical protein
MSLLESKLSKGHVPLRRPVRKHRSQVQSSDLLDLGFDADPRASGDVLALAQQAGKVTSRA